MSIHHDGNRNAVTGPALPLDLLNEISEEDVLRQSLRQGKCPSIDVLAVNAPHYP